MHSLHHPRQAAPLTVLRGLRLDPLSRWDWLVMQAGAIERPIPLTLHSQGGDREDWGHAGDLARGLPFSQPFLAYLEGRLPPSYLTDAVRSIRASASGRIEKVGADILRLIVAGERDPEVLRRRMRLTPGDFRAASSWALAALQRQVESPRARDDVARSNDDLLARQRMLRDRTSHPAVPGSPTA